MSNLDATLAGLAAEVNALEADRAASNRGKQLEMGHKLIAIRQILREVNGVRASGKMGVDGLPPIGWVAWVAENLSIGQPYANACIQFALNPEQHKQTQRRKANAQKNKPITALQYARKAWPTWTHEQREQFSAGVLALLKS